MIGTDKLLAGAMQKMTRSRLPRSRRMEQALTLTKSISCRSGNTRPHAPVRQMMTIQI